MVQRDGEGGCVGTRQGHHRRLQTANRRRALSPAEGNAFSEGSLRLLSKITCVDVITKFPPRVFPFFSSHLIYLYSRMTPDAGSTMPIVDGRRGPSLRLLQRRGVEARSRRPSDRFRRRQLTSKVPQSLPQVSVSISISYRVEGGLLKMIEE